MTQRFHYAMDLRIEPAPGYIASAALRDSLEHALGGALEPGDEVKVALEADGRMTISFAVQSELKDFAARGLRETTGDQISGAILPDENFKLGALELKAFPSRRA